MELWMGVHSEFFAGATRRTFAGDLGESFLHPQKIEKTRRKQKNLFIA
jgi:hypothetical protein